MRIRSQQSNPTTSYLDPGPDVCADKILKPPTIGDRLSYLVAVQPALSGKPLRERLSEWAKLVGAQTWR
jgi:hypothetical protein